MMLSSVCNPEKARIHTINGEQDDSGTQHPGFERHTDLSIGMTCVRLQSGSAPEPSPPGATQFDPQTDIDIE